MASPIEDHDPGRPSLTRPSKALGWIIVPRRAFSKRERAFLVAVPVAWAILLLFHPTGEGDDFYPVIRDEVTAWVVVHVGTMVFVPLMAVVGFLLLRGVEGTSQ
jgi:hypothetical protein